MKTMKYQLESLTCPSCINKIEKSIEKMKGVEEVKVLFHSSKVNVTFEMEQVTGDEIKGTIEKLGYPVIS